MKDARNAHLATASTSTRHDTNNFKSGGIVGPTGGREGAILQYPYSPNGSVYESRKTASHTKERFRHRPALRPDAGTRGENRSDPAGAAHAGIVGIGNPMLETWATSAAP
ncbi:hypothetical protein GCM10010371_68850 [Streptomyces subrutilus]|uniref:Uncharacterized protein n=1 Tax=Streptomyces subrutilus TaxID=36818 RepID=A0A918RHV1_9ACTN|nr:hypothetical protein GCM10010371_68850 [Streptomyces subrutilus]